ncbi:putative MPP superfamily phosphohydrolase [Rossellomorea marisflavi]
MWIISVLLIVGVALILYMVKEAFADRVGELTFRFPSYPADAPPLKMFFLSDIHKRRITENIIHAVEDKADVVVIVGDLTEGGVPLARVEKNLDSLSSIGPIFFVWGNNDYEVDPAMLKALFQKKGVREIVNDTAGYGAVTFIGVDDGTLERADLPRAMRGIDPDSCNILLSHDPSLSTDLTSTDGVDLMLSGHTHGGQIRLFGWGLYPKSGVDLLQAVTRVTSAGYGTSLLPLRLGAKAETHIITIEHRSGKE